MAITILKHGNKELTKRNFECPTCLCQFTADEDYYYVHGRYCCSCPECTVVAYDITGM